MTWILHLQTNTYKINVRTTYSTGLFCYIGDYLILFFNIVDWSSDWSDSSANFHANGIVLFQWSFWLFFSDHMKTKIFCLLCYLLTICMNVLNIVSTLTHLKESFWQLFLVNMFQSFNGLFFSNLRLKIYFVKEKYKV